MSKTIGFLFLLFAFPFICFSQTFPLSMEELFKKGVEKSLSIQSAQLELYMSGDKVSIAKDKYLPDIQLNGQFGFVGQPTVLNKDLSYMSHPVTPDWQQSYQVSAIQPIYEGGRIRNTVEKTELEHKAEGLGLLKSKSAVKLKLAGIYLSLCNLYQQQDIYHHYIEEAKVRVKNIRKMHEEGTVTSNDVLRSEIQQSDYELAYKEIANNISIASQQLAIAMGMDETLLFVPDTTVLNQSPLVSNMEDYLSRAYTSNLDLELSKVRTDIAKKELNITKGGFLPSLSFVATNSLQRPIPYIAPTQDYFLNTWVMALKLSYTPSNLFSRKRVLSEAHYKISSQQLAEELQKQSIRMEVKVFYTHYIEALDRLHALEHTSLQSQDNYRIVDKKYFNQLAILTDLLDANLVRLNTTLELTKAKVNAAYAYYQLLDLCGEL